MGTKSILIVGPIQNCRCHIFCLSTGGNNVRRTSGLSVCLSVCPLHALWGLSLSAHGAQELQWPSLCCAGAVSGFPGRAAGLQRHHPQSQAWWPHQLCPTHQPSHWHRQEEQVGEHELYRATHFTFTVHDWTTRAHTRIQEYKDVYLSVTLICPLKFGFVTFH